MLGPFKPGDLVVTREIVSWRIDLDSSLVGSDSQEAVMTVSHLDPGDVALVICTERADARNVYVLGPNGGGWTQGAYLRIAG